MNSNYCLIITSKNREPTNSMASWVMGISNQKRLVNIPTVGLGPGHLWDVKSKGYRHGTGALDP